jgi:spore coat polysaccharide biosynthesis protein SpsF
MGSTRLPGKLMYKIKDKTMLELYIERVNQSMLLDEIIVATTTNHNDDVIVDLIKEKFNAIKVFRGDENDVLDRYYRCAREYKSDIIVRLTPDDFFVDYKVIDKAIKLMVDNKYDFVCNHLCQYKFFPEGIDIEVYAFTILAYMWYKATLKSEREHVFPYIYNNKEKFNMFNFESDVDYFGYRWTLDHNEDFILCKKIYELWGDRKEMFNMNDIIEMYKQHPDLHNINNKIPRKQGINKSIVSDGGMPI